MTTDPDESSRASDNVDDLRTRLLNAAIRGDSITVADLCARHAPEIIRQREAWARAPDWARENGAAFSGWANATKAIAEQLNALGHPELLELVSGPGRENPAVRLRDTLAQAQKLAAAAERETSTWMLHNLLTEMEGASGPLIHYLRSQAFGTLADNALHAHDFLRLRQYTQSALAQAHEARDEDGVLTFTENLDLAAAIEAYEREGGLTGDLLHCRERIARAQELSDETNYIASNRILEEVAANLATNPDSAGQQYRAKVWGLLGLNSFRMNDGERAREYTERALAECTRTNDADGMRIYRANLEVINNVDKVSGTDSRGRSRDR